MGNYLNEGKGMLHSVIKKIYENKNFELTEKECEDIKNIVLQHCAVAAISGMAVGVLPGAGEVVAMGIASASMLALITRLILILKISIEGAVLRFLAINLVTQIVGFFAGIFAVAFVASFIPIAGIFTAGACNFAIVYIGSVLFLNLTLKFDVANLSNKSKEEIIEIIKAATKDVDGKKIVKEAKEAFNEMKKSGELEKQGKSIDLSEYENEIEKEKQKEKE